MAKWSTCSAKRTGPCSPILALPAGATHSRDKLASLLWSDRGDQQARDSLKHSLTKLRQCLPTTPQASIGGDRLSAKLDPAAVTIDVAEFERLARDGTPAALERAMALYRGELLDGIGIRDPAFEEWLLVERQRLRQADHAVYGGWDARARRRGGSVSSVA